VRSTTTSFACSQSLVSQSQIRLAIASLIRSPQVMPWICFHGITCYRLLHGLTPLTVLLLDLSRSVVFSSHASHAGTLNPSIGTFNPLLPKHSYTLLSQGITTLVGLSTYSSVCCRASNLLHWSIVGVSTYISGVPSASPCSGDDLGGATLLLHSLLLVVAHLHGYVAG
jgi:hypothetical protein